MHVTNLALATDLAVAALDAHLLDRGDHVVVSTPSNPDFYWGNYLVLPSPPSPATLPRWCALAEAAFPSSSHVALTWDGDDDDGGTSTVSALHRAGFTLDRTLALTGDGVKSVKLSGLTLRPLVGDADWAQLGALDLAIQDGGEVYRAFVVRKLAARRHACERGAAAWWGAFDGDTLVASAGIVRDGHRARYQDVQTAPAHRRRGIASALLGVMAGAEAAAGVDELVICVDVTNLAARAAYTNLGFVPAHVLVSACRAPATSAPASVTFAPFVSSASADGGVA